MPRFDGTGPVGAGRMTGWGQGPCEANGAEPLVGSGRGFVPGRGMRQGRGMGMGCGRGMATGRGFGLRYGYGPAWDPTLEANGDMQKEQLTQQRDFLKARLDAVDKRLETL